MAKLAFLGAFLLALLFLATASRTTITTTVVEEGNPRESQECREQIQREQQLPHCQRYLSQRSPYELVLNPREQEEQEQHLRQCCQQLQNIDEECRCEAVNEAVRQRQRQQEGGRQAEERRQVEQRAQDLPRRCNLEPQQCQIRAIWF
ncbi:unnamed protein product [Ilex paraguariensis]|uniref:Bifunctional inhibitor/plant lipid transfer protein/seed storage helical domain-containing protein n=1 Tax=Ilex paraguariensis TaxID=185542 RepID=A0ABC8RR37_9AQUA